MDPKHNSIKALNCTKFSESTDDDTQQDMFDNDSEGEAAEEETDTDFKWRKERFEREQFLKEQQVSFMI